MPAETTIEPMLDVPTVAAALGFSQYTIRKWASQGALPGARKTGGEWRFNAEKIRAYIAKAGGRR